MLIDGFNKSCSNIATSYLKVGDESMSVIRFCTTFLGDLTHLYYILRKPELLGTEFKKVDCSVTGSPIFLEIYSRKEGMKSSRYHLELGATSACTTIFMEEKTGLGQRSLKGSTSYFFLFDIWFS